MRSRRSASHLTENRKTVLLSVFLAAHLLAIAVYAIPFPDPMVRGVKRIIEDYVVWTGLWQEWKMFAPPRHIQVKLRAVIAGGDGLSHSWDFPDMERLGYLDRFRKERFRRWGVEQLSLDDRAFLWPPTALYIARMSAALGHRPTKVTLIRRWADITIPDSPPDWKQEAFYSYEVRPGDLR